MTDRPGSGTLTTSELVNLLPFQAMKLNGIRYDLAGSLDHPLG